jgi:hypothetical protein
MRWVESFSLFRPSEPAPVLEQCRAAAILDPTKSSIREKYTHWCGFRCFVFGWLTCVATVHQTYASDPKYKKYTQQVEKCLNAFDNVHEWADCIAFLKQLLKVLSPALNWKHWFSSVIHPQTFQSYMQFKKIPYKFIVAKRLAQCLTPALPTGVHQRALDVYTHIVSEESPLLATTAHELVYDRFAPDQKRWIVFLVSFAGFFPSKYWDLKTTCWYRSDTDERWTAFVSSTFVPSIPQIAKDLDSTHAVVRCVLYAHLVWYLAIKRFPQLDC